MKKASKICIRASLIVLFILFTLTPVAATKPVEISDEENLDDEVSCNGPPEKINSISELQQFEVDGSITGLTPHWIFLVAGKDDKKHLLKFINSFNLPNKQTNEWKRVLKKLWKKYPITFDNGVIVLDLSKKKAEREIILTKQEEKTLGEISDNMAKRMEGSAEPSEEVADDGGVIVQWYRPTHADITYLAFTKEGVPEPYAILAQQYSEKPDDMGFPVHQSTHYLNPDYYTGQAQVACELYADMALKDYLDHRWYDAYSQLGYSSHFLADVGNPLHTGAELQQGITSLMNLNIHDAYENYVYRNWENMFRSSIEKADASIVTSSPAMTTLRLAMHTHQYLPELNARIYWNWIWNGGNFNLNNDLRIYSITDDCLTTTGKYMRGLVRYLTIHGPIHFVITPSTGPHGSISPSEPVDVVYDGSRLFTLTPDSGYAVDKVLVNNVDAGPVASYAFTNVRADQTISATFKSIAPPSSITPLCKAGMPFDSSKYPQHISRSDPMVFECYWDGTGQVFISGDKSALTGIYADDGYTITIQPSGSSFETPEHWAHQHPVIELTAGMRQGSNTFTLVVQNWRRYSMSYGSSTGIGTDQTPYIIQINSPGAQLMTIDDQLAITSVANEFILNESVDSAEGIISDTVPS
jgi:hypothetical protein